VAAAAVGQTLHQAAAALVVFLWQTALSLLRGHTRLPLLLVALAELVLFQAVELTVLPAF
jgi:hypothetical protein